MGDIAGADHTLDQMHFPKKTASVLTVRVGDIRTQIIILFKIGIPIEPFFAFPNINVQKLFSE